MDTDLARTVRQLAEAARAASLQLAVASTQAKNRALLALAEKIESSVPAPETSKPGAAPGSPPRCSTASP